MAMNLEQVMARVDEGTREIDQLHAAAQQSMIAAIAFALDQPNPLAPSVKGGLERELASIVANTAVRIEERLMRGSLALVHNAYDALRMDTLDAFTASSEVVMSFTAPNVNTALLAIKHGIAVDAETVRKRYRAFQWELQSLTSATRTNIASAIVRARQGKVSSIPFDRPDNLGRTRSSLNQTHLTVRQTLLWAYCDAAVYLMSLRGTDTGRIVHLDDGHPNDGLVFSISGADTSVAAYLDIREIALHPNARALVTA